MCLYRASHWSIQDIFSVDKNSRESFCLCTHKNENDRFANKSFAHTRFLMERKSHKNSLPIQETIQRLHQVSLSSNNNSGNVIRREIFTCTRTKRVRACSLSHNPLCTDYSSQVLKLQLQRTASFSPVNTHSSFLCWYT